MPTVCIVFHHIPDSIQLGLPSLQTGARCGRDWRALTLHNVVLQSFTCGQIAMPWDSGQLLVVNDQNPFNGREFAVKQQAAFALLHTCDACIERRFGTSIQIKISTG